MDKRTETGLLFDFYGALLTERQRTMLDSQLNDDMSLTEISEREGVSRQAVRDAIVRGEEQLCEYERKLGMMKRDMELIKLTGSLIENEKDPAQRAGLEALLKRIEGNDGI